MLQFPLNLGIIEHFITAQAHRSGSGDQLRFIGILILRIIKPVNHREPAMQQNAMASPAMLHRAQQIGNGNASARREFRGRNFLP